MPAVIEYLIDDARFVGVRPIDQHIPVVDRITVVSFRLVEFVGDVASSHDRDSAIDDEELVVETIVPSPGHEQPQRFIKPELDIRMSFHRFAYVEQGAFHSSDYSIADEANFDSSVRRIEQCAEKNVRVSS